MAPSRVFAIDWSGDQRNARRKIWLGEAAESRLLRLANGKSREEIADFLLKEAARDPHFVVGLDFAFSFPRPFCETLQAATVHELWDRVIIEGETWLTQCRTPFWGRPGRKRPSSADCFRVTELAVLRNGSGFRPKSIFQIGGAGAVGTGSIRGMPTLKRLHDGGCSIWPFDPPAWPLVVEIYPRLFTGAVKKSSPSAREGHLKNYDRFMTHQQLDDAIGSEDAFDAAVAAIEMSHRLVEFERLEQATDAQELREGTIWY